MEKIKGVLITPNQKGSRPRVYEAEISSIDDYHKLLECDTFDIQTRKFRGKYFDIYCDDEGLFKEDNKPAIVTYDNGQMVEQIVGNVFITGFTDEGKTISLTDEECQLVLASAKVVILTKTSEFHIVLRADL